MAFLPLIAIPQESLPFTMLLPGINTGIQVTILLILYPLVALVFSLVFGYLMVPIYLALHKKVIGRRHTYGVYNRPPQERGRFQRLGRGFVPGLLMINFAILLVPFFSSFILYPHVAIVDPSGGSEVTFFAFIVLLLFTIILAALLFSGVWFLEDAGIVYSNKAKAEADDGVREIRSVGGWYYQFLQGYAGVGVVFSYIVIITNFWNSVLISVGDPSTLLLLSALIFPIPIYTTLACLPAVVLLDMITPHRNAYVLKIARRLGITETIEYPRN